MSGNEQPQQPTIMGAIQAPVTGVIDHNVPQPRQPSNLQGLLRFAVDATKTEDAPAGNSSFMPLDEERKHFLDDALKSMTVDVIELLQKNVQILRYSDTLSVDADVTDYMDAFETILEHVDRIDTAIDFHKIGGFMVFAPCFNSVHASIRAGACDLVAELCQNNPYCQQIVADTEIMTQLLGLLDKDTDENVQVKALYALSCNVREYPVGLAVFMKNDGLGIVHRALQRPIDKLRTKAAFLLSCLLSAEQDVQLRTKLVAMDTVPLLISLISQERLPSHEHLLMLLGTLVVNDATAAAQCTDPRYNFRDVVREHLQLVQGKPEYREEEQCCTILLNTVFKADHTATDR